MGHSMWTRTLFDKNGNRCHGFFSNFAHTFLCMRKWKILIFNLLRPLAREICAWKVWARDEFRVLWSFVTFLFMKIIQKFFFYFFTDTLESTWIQGQVSSRVTLSGHKLQFIDFKDESTSEFLIFFFF